MILRDGQRGRQFCVVVDRLTDANFPLLPYPATGSTERAHHPPVARQASEGLIALPGHRRRPAAAAAASPCRSGPAGWRGESGSWRHGTTPSWSSWTPTTPAGCCCWSGTLAGAARSSCYDTVQTCAMPVPGLPGLVASGALLSRDGRRAVLERRGSEAPARAVAPGHRDQASGRRPPEATRLAERPLVVPDAGTRSPGRTAAADRLAVPGAGATSRPDRRSLSLHGGPEAQERPTFNPQHQALVAAGITVFAPNIRGSSGFGRAVRARRRRARPAATRSTT